MLSVSEALRQVLENFAPLESEEISIDDAVGRVLAEPIRASIDLPPFTNSSMDGYAVRAADTLGASAEKPVRLRVVGDIPAGVSPSVSLGPGTAARIMTGAKVPENADAVVPMEATGLDRNSMDADAPAAISIAAPVDQGAYVRLVGEDVRNGETVVEAGRLVRPFDISLLASFGLERLKVVRRPRVAVLSTGNELVDIGQVPGPSQIRDSNSHAVAALVGHYGGDALRLGVASDSMDSVTTKLHEAVAQNVDLIISSAGVSVGAYDVVKAAISQSGSLDFWKVAMRPGKPLAFGNYQGISYFGLPGNPVSAVVTFELFVRPALLKLGGRRNLAKPRVQARLVEPVQSDGRESYLRGQVRRTESGYEVSSSGGQGSNMLAALSRANALIVVPSGIKDLAAGSPVETLVLDWPEDFLT